MTKSKLLNYKASTESSKSLCDITVIILHPVPDCPNTMLLAG